jgi:hypothetical protein
MTNIHETNTSMQLRYRSIDSYQIQPHISKQPPHCAREGGRLLAMLAACPIQVIPPSTTGLSGVPALLSSARRVSVAAARSLVDPLAAAHLSSLPRLARNPLTSQAARRCIDSPAMLPTRIAHGVMRAACAGRVPHAASHTAPACSTIAVAHPPSAAPAAATIRRHFAAPPTSDLPARNALPVDPVLPSSPSPVSSTPSRASAPPPMELPSFLQNALDYIRRRALASPNAHALQLYRFALKNPLARPSTSTASKWVAPVASSFALESLGLPTDELTQYRLIGLHMWILQKVLLLSSAGSSSQSEFLSFTPPSGVSPSSLSKREKDVIRFLFEHFWADLTPFLKEARGEIMLTKTLASVQQYFYGALLSLDFAWLGQEAPIAATNPAAAAAAAASADGASSFTSPTAAEPLQGREALAAALWRNYYMCSPTASKRDVYRLVFYVHRQIEHLLTLPKERLWYADKLEEIDWLPTHEIFAESESDRRMASRLLVLPEAWAVSSSFDGWQQTMFSGQTFDTRKN